MSGLVLGAILLAGFGVFPQGSLRGLVESRLRDSVGDGSRLGGLHVVPFLLEADARDLRLEGPGYTLTVPEARVALAPGVLRGRLALRRLEVDAPVLELTAEEAIPDETTAAPPPVEIEAVAIRDGSVRWTDPDAGELRLGGLSVEGGVGHGPLTIEVPRGEWRGETTVSLGPLRAELSVTPELDVALSSSELRLGTSTLRAHGPLARRGDVDLVLDLEAELDLADGGTVIGRTELDGTLAVTGRLRGPADRLEAELDARGSATWEPWSLDDLAVHVTAEPHVGQAFVRFEGRSLGGRLEGEAELSGAETRGSVHGRGLDLARLPPEMRPPAAVMGDEIDLRWQGPVDGPLAVEVAARGRGRHEHGTGRLEARAQGTVRPSDTAADLEWTARLRSETTGDDALVLAAAAQGRARGPWPPEVTAELTGALNAVDGRPEDEMTLAGTVRAQGEDLQARLHTAGPFAVVTELELQGDRIRALTLSAEEVDLARLLPEASGSASLRLEGSGPLEAPEISGRLTAIDLAWGGTSVGRVEMGVEGTTDRFAWRLTLPELAVEAQGDAEPERRVGGQAELRHASLARLAAVAGVADPLEGRLTATLGFDIPLPAWSEAAATLDVQALEGSHQGRAFRARPFRGELREGRIALRDVRVEGAGVSLDLDAAAGLEADAPVDIRAWLDADLGALPLPEGWSLSGGLSGAVAVTGTPTQPALEGAFHMGGVALERDDAPTIAVEDMEIHLGDHGLRVPGFVARVGDTGHATLEAEVPYAAVWPALRGGPLAPGDRARVSASWDGVTLTPLEGGLAGELTLEGGLAGLEELEGEMRLPARRLVFEGLTLELQPAVLRLEGGRVTTDGVTVRSTPGDLVVTGSADLVGDDLDVRAAGRFELGLLSPLLKEASVGGAATVDLAMGGPLAAPAPRGSVTVENVSIRMRSLPQAVTGIQGRVDVDGDTAALEGAGELGGGTLHLEGEARAVGTGLADLWLQLTGREVALRYPPGLRSRLDIDLTLAGQPGDLVLTGDVVARGGAYDLDTALREALRGPAPATTSSSEVLGDVALDVSVDVARPVVVESRLGRLEATGRINARGDLQEPAPFGRLDVRRGGRIELQGRDLTVTGGALTYSGSWNGGLSLSGETVVRGVTFSDGSQRDVQVRAALGGSMQEPSLTLSSTPPLSRQQIVSAIATGQLGSSLVDSSAWLLGGQAATLVSGQLTEKVAQSFGLDEITVRPDLLARETDPSARFTFGKRIGPPLALVYSAGLGGPETRFAELRGNPGFNLQLRAQRRDSGTHELGLGQRFAFGGTPFDESGPPSAPRLEEVRFEGGALPEELRRSVGVSPGKRVPDWRVQQEAERLRARLRRRGHLDAEVSARIEGEAAIFTVEPGPRYDWRIEGMADPPSLDRALEPSLFEADAVDRGRARLLGVLEERGHLRARVEAATADHGERREIVFTVVPGTRFEEVTVRFPGASVLSRRTLLDAAGGARGLMIRPEDAVAGIREAYRAAHLLAARVDELAIDTRGGVVTLTVAIDEGPPATLRWIRTDGAILPDGVLDEALRLPTGVPFSTAMVTEAVARVRAEYLSRGYIDVRIRPELVAEGPDLGLTLHVREGERRVIRSVGVSGNSRTRDWLVERALALEEGEPLDPRRLGEAERRLLGLGTFSRAAIVPGPDDPGALVVQVREAANLTAAYDVRWEDEVGWSGLVDGLADNLLGLGIGLGGRVRYGEQLREVRGSLHLPAALAGGDVTGSVFRTEEDIPADDTEIVRRQTGFQVQQSLGRASSLNALVGYRFRRNLTIAPTLPEIPIDIGGLDVSLLRTTQDDLLDPRRGTFWSLNLNLAPSWLGSDAPLVSTYAQTVLNRSFRDDTLTWAQSYRLGLAWGLEDEPVLSFERFRAGGASSLRGFGTNEVGPRGFFGEPIGGEAVVIVNQELRYHHSSGFGLVGFYDVGNVFATVDTMRFDLRHTLGAGLRWASPVGLLRLDLGFPVDRQPEEKSYRVFFGVGQAF
jgi:outer membrane protein assembly factor BamA